MSAALCDLEFGFDADQSLRATANVELRHLRYFLAAAEHGSFRKAALHLKLQQSAVSRGIRDLEDHLGASLFQRYNGGVYLTVAGRRFLPAARTVLRQLGDGAMAVASIGRVEAGHLRIGVFSSLASGFLAELLRIYHLEHPNVRLDVLEGDPAEHVAAVRQLKLDVAFVTGARCWAGCETTALWSERVFVVLPSEHLLTRAAKLRWPELLHYRFIVSRSAPGSEIYDYLVQRLADLGHHPEIERQDVGRDNLFTLVAMGRGLTLTSEAATALAFPDIAYRPIEGERLPFSAVWSRQNDNPAFRRLLSVARARAAERSVLNESPASSP